jgi:hypothetical protein
MAGPLLLGVPLYMWATGAGVSILGWEYYKPGGGRDQIVDAYGKSHAVAMSEQAGEERDKALVSDDNTQACGDCRQAGEKDRPYAGETPNDKPENFDRVRGRKGRVNISDGSYWEKDFSQHGGSEWKRWPSIRDYEYGRGRESVRGDGSVR